MIGTSKLRCWEQRHFVAVQCFLGLTISYMIRFCMSLALTRMASLPRAEQELYNETESCPLPPRPINQTSPIHHETEFSWTAPQQGLIQSSFFWGYCLSQLPGGLLADGPIGGRTMVLVGVTLSSVLSLLTPIAARIGGVPFMVALRASLGLAQGIVYPSLHSIVAQWIPTSERSTWATLVFSGAHAGNAMNSAITGLLLSYFPWPAAFHLYGLLGLLWSLLFLTTTYASPESHPNLSDREKRILGVDEITTTPVEHVKSKTPWKQIWMSAPIWAIILGMIGHDWGLFALITDVPHFMKYVLHYNLSKNGYVNAAMYIMIWVIAIGSGIIAGIVERREWLTTTSSRKLGTTISSLGPSLGLLGAVYTGCDPFLPTLCLFIGMGLMGFFYPSLKVNPIDLAPKHAGTVAALATSSGAISGIIVPYLIKVLTPNNTLTEWQLVMWITFVVMGLTNLFYVIFATAETQPWNYEEEEDPKKGSDNLGLEHD